MLIFYDKGECQGLIHVYYLLLNVAHRIKWRLFRVDTYPTYIFEGVCVFYMSCGCAFFYIKETSTLLNREVIKLVQQHIPLRAILRDIAVWQHGIEVLQM